VGATGGAAERVDRRRFASVVPEARSLEVDQLASVVLLIERTSSTAVHPIRRQAEVGVFDRLPGRKKILK
jgi:hypothetical protein